MSKAQYDIYRQSVLALARTLVVKSSAVADAINVELVRLGHTINENDPESWKYYKHLAGEYHYTDTMMTIKSLDTLEEIQFTKDNLRIHLATSREYRQFDSYYRAMVERYPDQEDLIQGILNPVDIDDAIAAEDGQILYYDPSLVESNEENLIPKLQWWCQVFSRRWLVRAYSLVDDLYVPAHFATMYMFIPSVVMNIRAANCHTNYAHSFHIREYLASHQKLDWAVDYMTKKQMLWLYREIRYIERNAGKQSTFKELIQNVMTERNLPLASWSMQHELSEMPEELTPRVEFTRSTLNLNLSAAGVETRNVIEMLQAEDGVAKGNSRVMDDRAPEIREDLSLSIHNRLETKILESAVIDTTDATFFTLADTLLNHWLYLSHLGTYTAVLTVDNPRTGAPLVLSVKEAFVVYLYVFGRAIGLEMVNIPMLPANDVRKLRIPSRNEVKGLIAEEYQDDEVIDRIFNAVEPLGNYISTEAFNRDIQKVHKGLMEHRWIWATRENKFERGMVEGAAMHLYHDYPIDLGFGQTFAAWFTERGLDMPQFTRLECSLLADTLVSYATGANLNATTSLRDIQTAMLRLMSTLSSYSIQFLQSINTQPLLVTDWPMPRIGAILGAGGDTIEGVDVSQGVEEINASGGLKLSIPNLGNGAEIEIKVKGFDKEHVEIDVDVRPSSKLTYHYRVELPETYIGDNYRSSELEDVTDTDTDSYTPMDALLLEDAFDHLISPHFAVDLDGRTTITESWNNRTDEGRPNFYLGGFRYPNMWTEITTVDIFAGPEEAIRLTSVLDVLSYPDMEATVVLDVLNYPGYQQEVSLEELNYPNSELVVDLDQLDYPNHVFNVTVKQLDYPSITYDVTTKQLDYPTVRITSVIDQLTYPAIVTKTVIDVQGYPTVDTTVDLDNLTYPGANLSVALEVAAYPGLDATARLEQVTYPVRTIEVEIDGFEDPTTIYELRSNNFQYPP